MKKYIKDNYPIDIYLFTCRSNRLFLSGEMLILVFKVEIQMFRLSKFLAIAPLKKSNITQ